MTDLPLDGRQRAVIENVTPHVDDGRFPVKRIVGDILVVQADVFGDGHDEVRARLSWARDDDQPKWTEVEMAPLGNDLWHASFPLKDFGRYLYSVTAWVDHWATWRRDLQKRIEGGQDVTVDLQIGAAILDATCGRATGKDAQTLRKAATALTAKAALADSLDKTVQRYPDLTNAVSLDQPLAVTVDPTIAQFSAWYEMFPRSASPDAARHGTFRDVIDRLDYVQELGFDVLYMPPIHPIGVQFRKGANNTPSTSPSDPGVPWAIGAIEGGHTAVHPDLGTLADFDQLVSAANAKGIEIALDIAFQASPDHPWVTEHPTWFRARPDGAIQYAENPPKKYQDIYPFDFESEDWEGLWQALSDVFRFWINHGATVFRVDNPHTKALSFWEWCISEIKRDHPEAIFLAEAFTRPKVMYRLAKLGFSQSYTYFTWRNNAAEMRQYLEELTSDPVHEFFRPNFWPNTPDILHADLQEGGVAAFVARYVMAATLSSNYGIYGPAFELMERTPREPGTEEYLDSEKYEQRTWDLESPGSLAPIIRTVNEARRAHPALQQIQTLRFHDTDNPDLLAYSKQSADGSDTILCVVNFDYHAAQSGTLDLNLGALGVADDAPFAVHDLLDGETYLWRGPRPWIELDPQVRAAHVFSLGPAGRSK